MQNILGSPDKQWTSPYTQQGDVLIKKIGIFNVFEKEYEKIPNEKEEMKGNLVLKGQTNSHALYGGDFILSQKDGVTFLEVVEPTVLDHVKDHTQAPVKAEHHAQWIPVGQYFIDGILEYDHIKEESRQVID